MKIHFTASTAEFKKYKKLYFEIRNHLIKQGHTLTRDWLPLTVNKIESCEFELNNIDDIYRQNVAAILAADIVIIEDTVSNFSTGHQATLAIQEKKPTLVMWSKPKHKVFKKMFIHGIKVTTLDVVEYNKKNVKTILDQFINKYAGFESKTRFHLVLDNHERSYLDYRSNKDNLSRTEIIKQGIKIMIKNDIDYQSYLGNRI